MCAARNESVKTCCARGQEARQTAIFLCMRKTNMSNVIPYLCDAIYNIQKLNLKSLFK